MKPWRRSRPPCSRVVVPMGGARFKCLERRGPDLWQSGEPVFLPPRLAGQELVTFDLLEVGLDLFILVDERLNGPANDARRRG